ncbi:MAG: alkaline phosphatase family protein [Actinobacteria bacterium]|nr:MAG: alkaline phosphatase family protein [Actinomycetota bacterium]
MPDWYVPSGDIPSLTEVLGACIASVDPHLPGANSAAQEQFGLDASEQVLVIMVDGLGWVPLSRRIGHAGVLRSHRDQTTIARTVVPSTTAAAIASFGTGAQPAETSMVGYSVAHGDSVMNLLAFDEGVDASLWQPMPTHFERLAQVGVETAVVSPPHFASSGLTLAALRGSRHVGAVSWEQRMDAVLRELRSGTPLVYLYWSDIDHIGHSRGCESPEWTTALEEFDAGLRELLRRLPKGVSAVLTADHGMVDIRPSDLYDLADTPELREGVRMIAGETRALHLHAEKTRAQDVCARWAEYLGDHAQLYRKDELASLMGEGPGLELIGDAVVFMGGREGVVDSRVQSAMSISLIGVHGSLTEDEMLIPVMRLA